MPASQALHTVPVTEDTEPRSKSQSGAIPNPNKLAAVIFAPYKKKTLVLMRVARELPDEPDRWKIPQWDLEDINIPMREAITVAVDRAFKLKPEHFIFSNSLPGPVHEKLEPPVRGLHYTNTYFGAISCPEPYEFMVNAVPGTSRWTPYNEVLQWVQSYKRKAYTLALRMVRIQPGEVPLRFDH